MSRPNIPDTLDGINSERLCFVLFILSEGRFLAEAVATSRWFWASLMLMEEGVPRMETIPSLIPGRRLIAARYQGLADMPAEAQWFAYICGKRRVAPTRMP